MSTASAQNYMVSNLPPYSPNNVSYQALNISYPTGSGGTDFVCLTADSTNGLLVDGVPVGSGGGGGGNPEFTTVTINNSSEPVVLSNPVASQLSLGTCTSLLASDGLNIDTNDNNLNLTTTGFINLTSSKITCDGPLYSPTPATDENSTEVATTAYVQNNLDLYAPLASPTFTGIPLAPTPATDDSSTKIATTAYVQSNLGSSAFYTVVAPANPSNLLTYTFPIGSGTPYGSSFFFILLKSVYTSNTGINTTPGNPVVLIPTQSSTYAMGMAYTSTYSINGITIYKAYLFTLVSYILGTSGDTMSFQTIVGNDPVNTPVYNLNLSANRDPTANITMVIYKA